MNLTMTVMKEGDDCQFFADEFPTDPKTRFAMTANPITFSRRYLFNTDAGKPMLTLSLEQAKKMAKEILAL